MRSGPCEGPSGTATQSITHMAASHMSHVYQRAQPRIVLAHWFFGRRRRTLICAHRGP